MIGYGSAAAWVIAHLDRFATGFHQFGNCFACGGRCFESYVSVIDAKSNFACEKSNVWVELSI